MTTITMLKSIANNNFKAPKTKEWKEANIPAESNFVTHIERAWAAMMKGYAIAEDSYFDTADAHISAAFTSLDIVPAEYMVRRVACLLSVKTVKDKLRYTSKTTFRKNALAYLLDVASGESGLVPMDEKWQKALNPKVKKEATVTITKLTPEQMRAFISGLTPEQKAALLDAVKAA